ncbi:hypothetical protein [Brevundimonas sp. R86498]|uniref:hypothetical protein n=1 Tax=Brevundimonas sp. R86498 TaxID=3093845 RepID=UPI0037C76B91
MNSYYCIVHLAGAPYREIVAVRGSSDHEARLGLAPIAGQWPGFETIALYDGERPVSVLTNPALGFPPGSLESWGDAA